MKFLVSLMVLLIPVPLLAGEAAKLPSEASRIVERYDRTVEAAEKAFRAVVEKARVQTLKDLNRVLDYETRKGNLDTALLIRNKIEALTPVAPPIVVKAEPIKDTPAENLESPKGPSYKLLIGKWSMSVARPDGGAYTNTVEIEENGKAKRTDTTGTYTINKNGITIKWSNGGIWTMNTPEAGSTVTDGTSPSGKIRYERK